MSRFPLPLALPVLALSLAASLAGCTHLGTNMSGKFSCRAPGGQCQPVSAIDAKATHDLLRAEGDMPEAARPRIGVAGKDSSRTGARTGERTLRVVLPAHVDSAGLLHDAAVVWAVVEEPHWTGEPRRGETGSGKDPMRLMRQSLRDAARKLPDANMLPSEVPDPEPLAPEGSAPSEASALPSSSPFIPASPPALPSSGSELDPGPRVPHAAGPAAEGSITLPTPRDRTPRPSLPRLTWPSAAAIDAAKASPHAARLPSPRPRHSRKGGK